MSVSTAQSNSHLWGWQAIAGMLLLSAAAICFVLSAGGIPGCISISSALAEDEPGDGPGFSMSRQELKATVDHLAVALSGILHSQKTDADRKAILQQALDTLTSQAEQEVYYTAWQGTEVVHSPFMPDLAGEDFRYARDVHGNTFVAEIEGQAYSGGFIKVFLPSFASGDAGVIEQWAYARLIPEGAWHIAAFMPVDKRAHIAGLRRQEEQRMQTGFLYSGFSLAGLAGVLFVQNPRGRNRQLKNA